MSGVRGLWALILVLCLAAPAAAQTAAEGGVEQLVSAMQERYESLESFEAGFTQRMTNAASGETVERTGTILFKRPSMIRWQTETPEPELLIIGPQDVWTWFALEETAYRYTVDQVLDSKTMLRFISGRASLDEDFWVADMGTEDGLRKLQLMPKQPETSLVEALMWVDPERAVMVKTTVFDFFGNENTVELTGLELDVPLDDDVFTFTPPQGADVFDNRGKPGVTAEPLN